MMRYLLPLLLLGALTGCFGGGEVVPQNHYYHLADISGETSHVEKHFGVIAVSPLQSDALHHERMILYSLQSAPLMLNTYYYHLWSNEPGQMLQEYLISYLRAAGVADTVVRYGEREHIDGQVSGYIHRLERIIGEGNPKVVVRLELSYRSRTPGTPVALTRVYNVEREAADDSMSATVKAFSEAVQTIYARFVAEMAH